MPHQHIRAPEVQTTGDTTPVQQIVYAERSRHRVEEMHKLERASPKRMWLRLLRSCGHRTGHAVIRFPLLDLLVQDLSDFSTARSLLTPSMVSVKERHPVCAAAIVQGVPQQATAIKASKMLCRISASRPLFIATSQHNTQTSFRQLVIG